MFSLYQKARGQVYTTYLGYDIVERPQQVVLVSRLLDLWTYNVSTIFEWYNISG